MKQITDIYGLPHFDPKGEPNSLSVRWKRWKRAFNLYVASKGVTNEGQKIALLLHSGGMELQEIYYTLVPEDIETTFNDCLAALDNYFTPKVNVPFERHVFRQMQQMEGETIDQFVCRLRQKAISCDFANVDEAIRDQIIEKCKDSRLRRKFLEKASDATLTVLQETARVHQAVNTQMRSMGSLERVNRISPKDHQRKEKEWKRKSLERKRRLRKKGNVTVVAELVILNETEVVSHSEKLVTSVVSLVILQPVVDLKWKRKVQVENSVQMVLIKSQRNRKKIITLLL